MHNSCHFSWCSVCAANVQKYWGSKQIGVQFADSRWSGFWRSRSTMGLITDEWRRLASALCFKVFTFFVCFFFTLFYNASCPWFLDFNNQDWISRWYAMCLKHGSSSRKLDMLYAISLIWFWGVVSAISCCSQLFNTRCIERLACFQLLVRLMLLFF